MESHPQNPEFRNNPENFHPESRDIDEGLGQNQYLMPDLIAAYICLFKE